MLHLSSRKLRLPLPGFPCDQVPVASSSLWMLYFRWVQGLLSPSTQYLLDQISSALLTPKKVQLLSQLSEFGSHGSSYICCSLTSWYISGMWWFFFFFNKSQYARWQEGCRGPYPLRLTEVKVECLKSDSLEIFPLSKVDLSFLFIRYYSFTSIELK